MAVITLTTDFGSREDYPAAIKGEILSITPTTLIVDITHDIQPQHLQEAVFILEINMFYFPSRTIHIAVIDPGVGTARRAIAGWIGQQCLVAPDNSVPTRVLQHG